MCHSLAYAPHNHARVILYRDDTLPSDSTQPGEFGTALAFLEKVPERSDCMLLNIVVNSATALKAASGGDMQVARSCRVLLRFSGNHRENADVREDCKDVSKTQINSPVVKSNQDPVSNMTRMEIDAHNGKKLVVYMRWSASSRPSDYDNCVPFAGENLESLFFDCTDDFQALMAVAEEDGPALLTASWVRNNLL